MRGALGALLVAGALTAVNSATAFAVDSSPGECADASGVTVVVDFTDLGGAVVVRCVRGPLPDGMSGLEALRGAGFTVEGTARWGDAFVCRIQGRPAADESLSFDGEDDYHERCQDTPPAQAYWGYWYADDGGSWRYSSQSAASRQVNEGGFEGWAFSLDESSGKRVPGYTPDRPDGTPPTTEPAPDAGGDGNGGGGHGGQPDEGAGDPAPSTSVPSPPATTAPAPVPTEPTGTRHRRPAEDERQRRDHRERAEEIAPPRGSSYRSDAQLTGELPAVPATSADGSSTGTAVGAALLLVVGCVGGGIAWWRRRSRP